MKLLRRIKSLPPVYGAIAWAALVAALIMISGRRSFSAPADPYAVPTPTPFTNPYVIPSPTPLPDGKPKHMVTITFDNRFSTTDSELSLARPGAPPVWHAVVLATDTRKMTFTLTLPYDGQQYLATIQKESGLKQQKIVFPDTSNLDLP